MTSVYLVLVLLFTLLLFIYKYLTSNFSFWQKINIPYVKPTFISGNLTDVVLQKTSIGQCLKKIYDDRAGKPYIGIFGFHIPALLVCDLHLIKMILVKDAHVFINHTWTVHEKKDPLLHNMMFTLRGQKWKHVRANLSPTFTSGKMKRMFYLVDNCGKELVNFLDRATKTGCDVEVMDTTARFTTDVIASCAFGIESNSLKDPRAEFRHVLQQTVRFGVKKSFATVMSFFSPQLMKLLRLQIMEDWVMDFYRQCVWSTVEYREKNGVTRGDFLDSLINLRNKGMEQDPDKAEGEDMNESVKMDGDVLVAQAFVFLLGGFETSSSTMTFALYELALNPDLQHRLRDEITRVLTKHNNEVTYEGMREMTYLDMVVAETMRKYPVLPFLDRVSVTDYELPVPPESGAGKTTLPAGTAVFIPVLGIHYNPEYYPEPHKFDPERFTEENRQDRHHFTYLPFGEGPRMCIGMRFGLMQTKIGLIHILSNYEVTPSKDTPVPLEFDPKVFFVTIKGDAYLTFNKLTILN